MIIMIRKGAEPEKVEALKEWLSKYDVTIDSAVIWGSVVLRMEGDLSKVDTSLIKRFDCVAMVTSTGEPYKYASRRNFPDNTVIRVGNRYIGNDNFTVIAGPCSVESTEQIQEVALAVKNSGASILRGGAFKPRTSPYAFQGLKSRGIEMMVEAKKLTGMPIVSEIVDISALPFFENVDIIQVGARNMQNFELLRQLGHTAKPILLKRGLANTYQELLMSAEYIMASGNENVILCERGIRTFESFTRNTLDISAVPVLKKLTHLPIIVDPSHAVGISEFIPPLALAAVAAGADGLKIEVHNNPARAKSDGMQSLTPEQFSTLMSNIALIEQARKACR